mmetsp:Transcript_154155/g.494129  ORF Transcript_154155/g.494129 Transcript_154155/m.494129 type:complete len:275 (-) Transcript_154155:100-924(-)
MVRDPTTDGGGALTAESSRVGPLHHLGRLLLFLLALRDALCGCLIEFQRVHGRTKAAQTVVESLRQLEQVLQAVRVVPIKVVFVEAFLLHETHASVERQSPLVGELGFQNALVRTQVPHLVQTQANELGADFLAAQLLLHREHGDVPSVRIAASVHLQLADNGANTPIPLHGEEAQIRPVVDEISVCEDGIRLREVLLDQLDYARHVTLIFVRHISDVTILQGGQGGGSRGRRESAILIAASRHRLLGLHTSIFHPLIRHAGRCQRPGSWRGAW